MISKSAFSLLTSIWHLYQFLCGTSLAVQWMGVHCQHRAHGFGPWARKISRAAEQLSPSVTAIELHPRARTVQWLKPICYNDWSPCTSNSRSATREATAMRSLCIATENSPCSLQLEKAHVQQWRASTAKNIICQLKKFQLRQTQHIEGRNPAYS